MFHVVIILLCADIPKTAWVDWAEEAMEVIKLIKTAIVMDSPVSMV
jgi:hypothetical protein